MDLDRALAILTGTAQPIEQPHEYRQAPAVVHANLGQVRETLQRMGHAPAQAQNLTDHLRAVVLGVAPASYRVDDHVILQDPNSMFSAPHPAVVLTVGEGVGERGGTPVTVAVYYRDDPTCTGVVAATAHTSTTFLRPA